MYAALLAGSIVAIVDALGSLPLRSPDDALFNSATVVVGALLCGVAAGAVWRLLANSRNRRARFALIWPLCFVPIAALAVVGDTQLDRFASFAFPLILIAFGLTGTLTITIARTRVVRWWLAPAAVVLALAVGIGFADRGDERSGRLELPPRVGLIEWSEGTIEI